VAVFLALLATLQAAVVRVHWFTLDGTPVGFVTNLKDHYLLKLCVNGDENLEVALVLRGDSPMSPKYYETVLIASPKGSCRTVLLYFKNIPKNLKVQPDVAIKVKGVAGIYADLDVNGVKMERMGYLKVLDVKDKETFKCLDVRASKVRVLIGDTFNVTISNKCDVAYLVTAKGDVENFVDISITKALVRPHETVTLTVSVPKFVGVSLTGALGIGPTINLRGVYLDANGTAVYYVPVYDYFLYFIKPNARAVWYVNGIEVRNVKAGSMVTGCVEVPSIVPSSRVPTVQAKLKVIEDLMFMPDKVVAKKDVSISQLPFKKCIEFIAKKSWNTRGYKLELDVKEDISLFNQKVPMVATLSLGPELTVR